MLELLLPLFYMLAAGALWRLVGGIVQGMKGHRPHRTAPPVHMVRDPVCGTYVIPDHAIAMAEGRTRVYFCSIVCRDAYRARPSTHSTGSGRLRARRRADRMTLESSLRADIVEVGRRLYARGYTASNDGNVSVRLGEGRLLMTPKSVCKGFMTPDMMCITDLDGRKLQGERDPSSEMLMHLEVYRQRPDIHAVVHAHPPTATGFAVAGIPLDRAVLAEVIATLGSIPIAEYATPSTTELPEAVRKYIKAHDGMLLANHGALTVGTDLFGAYYKMETIEHFAKISLVARLLGRENLIAREELDRLQELRGTYGIKAPAPICADDQMNEDQVMCQIVQSPAGSGMRLVPDTSGVRPPDGGAGAGRPVPRETNGDTEIRLTYRQLSTLIEDAIRSLR